MAMIRVLNKHTASIDGIAPGQEGEVDDESAGVQMYLEGDPDADPPVPPLLVKSTAAARKRLAAEQAEAGAPTDPNSENTPPAVGTPEGTTRIGTGEEVHAPTTSGRHRR